MLPASRTTGSSRPGIIEHLKTLTTILPLGVALLGGVRYAAGRHLPWSVYAILAVMAVMTGAIAPQVWRRRKRARQTKVLTDKLQAVVQDYAEKKPAGYLSGPHVTMADLVSDELDSLYVEPEFEISGERSESTAVELICRSLRGNRSIAVLGEPGQGKSLVLTKAYAQLLRQFMAEPAKTSLPVLLRMHSLPLMGEEGEPLGAGGSAERVAGLLCDALTLPESLRALLEDLIGERRIVLLLDGADEMRLQAARSAHFDDVGVPFSLLFKFPVALSSRTDFYQANIAPSRTGGCFAQELRLEEWSFSSSGKSLILRICARSGRADGNRVSAAISESSHLMDLARNPLTLFMMADVLASRLSGSESLPGSGDWQISDLYEEYCLRWLQVEASKGGRVEPEVKLYLMQLAAWKIFTRSGISGAQMGRYQLRDLLLRGVDLQEIARETVSESRVEVLDSSPRSLRREMENRSFLVPADRVDYYRFIHKSFFEYFTARHIWFTLSQAEAAPVQLKSLMTPVIPDEINGFLRSLLRRGRDTEAIRRINEVKLLETFERSSEEADQDAMIRQQVMNLLPIVWSPTDGARLLRLLASDDSPLVRRGGAVRLALEGVAMQPLDSFVREMRNPQSDAWKVHLGYNRIYYGDQVNRMPGWQDDGTRDCDGVFLASLSQLQRATHRVVWPMALTTIRLLLLDPERSAISLFQNNAQIAATVTDLGNRPRPEAGDVYEEERLRLAELIRGLSPA